MDKTQAHTFLIPIPAGKTSHFQQVAQEALGKRFEHHHQSRHQQGFTKEKAWVHRTLMGDMLVVYLEGNVERGLKEIATSAEPHDVWFRENILAALDLDLSKGMPPFGELVWDWNAA
jgi:hypothetical protein